MLRHAGQDEQVGQDIDHIDRLQLAADPDGQALMGELIDDVEGAELAAIVGPLLDEVIGPDVIPALGPKPDAGAVAEPQPPAFRLPGRHLQPFLAPDPLDALVVDHPAGVPQQGADLAIAISAVLTCQLDQVGREVFVVVAAPRHLALRRSMLTERPAGAALGNVQHITDMVDANASASGAQKFPRDASCRISLSSVRSAIALRSRLFSVSRSFIRLTWSDFSPPYSCRQR